MNQESRFELSAKGSRESSVISELFALLREHRKYWLLPILLLLLLFGGLMFFSGTAAAPFIYTLF